MTTRDWGAWTPSAKDVLWLRTILHYFALDRAIYPQEELAQAAGISKDLLIRFKEAQRTARAKTDFDRARKIARALFKFFEQRGPGDKKLEPVLSLVVDLFPELKEKLGGWHAPPGDMASDAALPRVRRIVEDERIRNTRLPIRIDDEYRSRAMKLLQGLWFVVRPASALRLGDGAGANDGPRYSVSLMNIVPEEIEADSYPYFKLRQGGDARKQREPFTLSGVVAPQATRVYFVGRHRAIDRLFAMTAPYDLDAHEQHVQWLDGVVLGITSLGFNVACAHVCLYIPKTDSLSNADFNELDARLVRQIGVKNESELVGLLRDNGLDVKDTWDRVKVAFEKARTFTDD